MEAVKNAEWGIQIRAADGLRRSSAPGREWNWDSLGSEFEQGSRIRLRVPLAPE